MRVTLDELEERIAEIAPIVEDLEITDLTETVRAGQWGQLDTIWANAEGRLRALLAQLPPNRLRSLALSTVAVADGDYEIDCQTGHTSCYGNEFLRMASTLPSLASLRELVIQGSGLRRESIPELAKLEKLEKVRLGSVWLDSNDLAELRAALPNVVIDILSSLRT